jgi:hypothetical protein
MKFVKLLNIQLRILSMMTFSTHLHVLQLTKVLCYILQHDHNYSSCVHQGLTLSTQTHHTNNANGIVRKEILYYLLGGCMVCWLWNPWSLATPNPIAQN